MVHQGGSPRATLALAAMARAVAWFQGRDYVLPQDVAEIFRDVIAHRLILTARGAAQGVDVAGEVLKSVPAPRVG